MGKVCDKYLYSIDRSGGGDCQTEGVQYPEDDIPSPTTVWKPPYSSQRVGAPNECGLYRYQVSDRNGVIFTTGGQYSYCNLVDRGIASDAACTCTSDSCRVDCAGAPHGFCCIDHSFTDRLLQSLKN